MSARIEIPEDFDESISTRLSFTGGLFLGSLSAAKAAGWTPWQIAELTSIPPEIIVKLTTTLYIQGRTIGE